MNSRFFRFEWLAALLVLPACSSDVAFVGSDSGTDAISVDGAAPHQDAGDASKGGDAARRPHVDGSATDDASKNDAADAPVVDASGSHTDGGAHVDAASSADAGGATHPDAANPTDASSSVHDAHVASFPDASAAVAACESCLQSTCVADVDKCEADPSCTATISCAISSGCIAAGDGGVETCVDMCVKSQDLTVHEQVVVVQEIAALSSCAAPCLSSCGAKDGGTQ